ncbi:MAG TPA: hypothetical protein VFM96_06245 [Gaiellaceae bacterium]|nr:hypothetical protein [Gaiellaceae bacterium]
MRALRRDDGFALVLALACIVVFGISTAAAISYTTSNQQASFQSASDLQARQYAEAGLNDAYSTLVHANSSGSDPTATGLLGTSASPLVFCVTTTSCSSGSVGSTTVAGCYGGTAGATCTGISPSSPSSTWVIVATGYARKPDGTTISRSMTAEVVISPLSAGAIAAVWNHVFITAPPTNPQTCQLDFGGNSTTINVPLYVIGNLCLPGNTSIEETPGGQAVDLQVGGLLYMHSGNSTHVGASATSPITSGVVVGGCTNVSVTSATSPCDGTNPAFNYWVKTKDAFVPNDAPAKTDAGIQTDYNTFSPGPKNPCTSSTGTPPTFDNDGVYNDSNGTVNLTPTASYTCTTSSGTLSWNNSTGVLTVAGSIFFDGNVTVSQTAVYSGTAVLEMAGTFAMSANNISLCAVAGCTFTSWQGSSGNNSMLTVAPVIKNAVAFTMSGNSETFQGSMWTQPSSSVAFTSNSTTIQGPISVGSISSSLNNTVIQPLPVIKNMPVGAPIPPNTSVSIGSLSYIK